MFCFYKKEDTCIWSFPTVMSEWYHIDDILFSFFLNSGNFFFFATYETCYTEQENNHSRTIFRTPQKEESCSERQKFSVHMDALFEHVLWGFLASILKKERTLMSRASCASWSYLVAHEQYFQTFQTCITHFLNKRSSTNCETLKEATDLRKQVHLSFIFQLHNTFSHGYLVPFLIIFLFITWG